MILWYLVLTLLALLVFAHSLLWPLAIMVLLFGHRRALAGLLTTSTIILISWVCGYGCLLSTLEEQLQTALSLGFNEPLSRMLRKKIFPPGPLESVGVLVRDETKIALLHLAILFKFLLSGPESCSILEFFVLIGLGIEIHHFQRAETPRFLLVLIVCVSSVLLSLLLSPSFAPG